MQLDERGRARYIVPYDRVRYNVPLMS